MTSDTSFFDEPDDELQDFEFPDVPDDEDDDTPTVSCSECGAEVYEDALRCPLCGAYITPTPSGHLWTGRPLWWILLGVLGIVAVIVVLGVL